jgi:hypothetical protein
MFDLGSFLTAAIAAFAVAIAWGQWYTARSKLVLDLFDQRMKVYDGACAVIARVMGSATANTQDVLDVARQGDRAKFLFGDDVCRYLASVQKALAQLQWCQAIISQRGGDEQYNKAVAFQDQLLMGGTINDFYEDFAMLLRPYMRMDHKRPMSWVSRLRALLSRSL